MSKIRVLSEQLANQIAAGEVVERPASVVKELLENSLDASASRIQVEIEGSGTRLIRIIDDGEGMGEDDLLLCLERHGTSKIKSQEDLANITSLGFRGEAIPSIGSVSILSITSRTKDSDLGYKVEVKYGKLTKSHEQGCPVGTIVEVRNLFGNTPARKKFLRTARTEQNHIDEVIKNYSLASPALSFELRIDGRQTINLPTGQTLPQRLSKIMRYGEDFLPVDFKDEGHHVQGHLVSPEKVQPGPARMRIFINGRAIKDRMIIHATAEGMRGFLMKGKNPAGLITISMPADAVDVNVHPAKHEIRFRNSRMIHHLVQRAVEEAMRTSQRNLQQSVFGSIQDSETTPIPQDLTGFRGEQEEDTHITPPEAPVPQEIFTKIPPPTPYGNEKQSSFSVAEKEDVEFRVTPTISESRESFERQTTPSQMGESFSQAELHSRNNDGYNLDDDKSRSPNSSTERLSPERDASPQPTHSSVHGLSILGQVDNLYIFCKGPKGIVVIDQHAAHERLIYEKLKLNFHNNSVVKQNLLFPETVELSLQQASLVEKHLEDIERMGFSLREFGGESYVISAVPALAGQVAPQKIFFDVLEQFGTEGHARKDAGDMLDTVLATMACRAAVKAGTGLGTREIESLLEEMATANLFSHCPHGRPVVKQFTSEDIKKWFYRT